MSDKPSILDPYQGVGHAWNVIQNVKAQLPTDLYNRMNTVLVELDSILMALRPPKTIQPIPPYASWCEHCTEHVLV